MSNDLLLSTVLIEHTTQIHKHENTNNAAVEIGTDSIGFVKLDDISWLLAIENCTDSVLLNNSQNVYSGPSEIRISPKLERFSLTNFHKKLKN